MARISIIIPVYNTEQYLTRCFDSLLNQTFTEIEIIVVNDGSVDKSVLICQQYADNYPKKFKFFSQVNQGQSSARNLALQYVTGDYLTFVDSDDWLESDALELMYRDALNNDSDIVVCDFKCYRTDTPEYIDFIREFKKNKYIPQKFICGKLYKTSFWQANQFTFVEGIYYEDLEIVPKILFVTNKISIVENRLYNYELRNVNSTTKRIKNNYFEIIFRNLMEFYRNKHKDKLFEKQLCGMLLVFIIYYDQHSEIAERVFQEYEYILKFENGISFYQKFIIFLVKLRIPLSRIFYLLQLRRKLYQYIHKLFK